MHILYISTANINSLLFICFREQQSDAQCTFPLCLGTIDIGHGWAPLSLFLEYKAARWLQLFHRLIYVYFLFSRTLCKTVFVWNRVPTLIPQIAHLNLIPNLFMCTDSYRRGIINPKVWIYKAWICIGPFSQCIIMLCSDAVHRTRWQCIFQNSWDCNSQT